MEIDKIKPKRKTLKDERELMIEKSVNCFPIYVSLKRFYFV